MRSLLFGFLISVCALSAAAPSMQMLSSRAPAQIVVNNRVLAKVNDRPITVLDVVRKMDMVFYQQFPQYASSPEARFQFYESSWKHVLNELVDKELIMADARQVEMKLSDADIRKEMEENFGPNVAVNLDKAGLSYDEARQILQDDITLKRMLYLRVHSKAFGKVTPQTLRGEYKRFLDEYNRSDEWHFRVITVRDPSEKGIAKLQQSVPKLLNQKKPASEDILFSLKRAEGYSPFTSVKVSDLFEQKEQDISDKFKGVLSQLSPGQYSSALPQSKGDTFKILLLENVEVDEYPAFTQMAPKLRGDMIGSASEKEIQVYKKKLRKQFPITLLDHLLESNFKPFALEQN